MPIFTIYYTDLETRKVCVEADSAEEAYEKYIDAADEYHEQSSFVHAEGYGDVEVIGEDEVIHTF